MIAWLLLTAGAAAAIYGAAIGHTWLAVIGIGVALIGASIVPGRRR